MNGAVFLIWFQSNLHASKDRHLGEFSDAEIAACQAVHTRQGLRRRLIAGLAALRDGAALLLPAKAGTA